MPPFLFQKNQFQYFKKIFLIV